jgi:peptidoglycan/LPS O-acetylase OafA/YrhL
VPQLIFDTMTIPPHSYSKKFETLDALRFFAFLRVFLLHIPRISELPLFNSIKEGGEIGVDFFFVLSGFLITYLLAKEKQAAGTVCIKQFMLRRIFRIWPLYYLGIAMAYTNIYVSSHYNIGSAGGYSPNILFSVTFTENIKMVIEDNFPNGAPLRVLWSLCIEEQFYVLWVLLFKFVKLNQLLKVFSALLVFAWCYRVFITPLLHNTVMTDMDLVSKLDYFCFGGGLAICMVVYTSTSTKLRAFFSSGLQLPVSGICFAFFFFHQLIPGSFLKNPVYFPSVSALLFTILIACFVLGNNKKQISNHSLLGKWGNISYGLYVYHTPVILAGMVLWKKLQLQSNSITLLVFISVALAVTLLVSYLSYRFFERPFLQLREKLF